MYDEKLASEVDETPGDDDYMGDMADFDMGGMMGDEF